MVLHLIPQIRTINFALLEALIVLATIQGFSLFCLKESQEARLVNSTSACSLAPAAPESSDLTASGIASARESALPAATSAAAAFMRTTSRRDDFLPSRISRMICALA